MTTTPFGGRRVALCVASPRHAPRGRSAVCTDDADAEQVPAAAVACKFQSRRSRRLPQRLLLLLLRPWACHLLPVRAERKAEGSNNTVPNGARESGLRRRATGCVISLDHAALTHYSYYSCCQRRAKERPASSLYLLVMYITHFFCFAGALTLNHSRAVRHWTDKILPPCVFLYAFGAASSLTLSAAQTANLQRRHSASNCVGIRRFGYAKSGSSDVARRRCFRLKLSTEACGIFLGRDFHTPVCDTALPRRIPDVLKPRPR